MGFHITPRRNHGSPVFTRDASNARTWAEITAAPLAGCNQRCPSGKWNSELSKFHLNDSTPAAREHDEHHKSNFALANLLGKLPHFTRFCRTCGRMGQVPGFLADYERGRKQSASVSAQTDVHSRLSPIPRRPIDHNWIALH